jgi:HlyD family secretion protein
MVKKGVITSPISGTIIDTYFNAGEIIIPGSNIAEISDLSNLWIKIYVPEKYLYKVSLNKDVAINVSSINKKINGKVVYISPNGEFTPKNTTTESSKEDIVYEVKIQIKDNVKELKPGMLADVTI